ncbi:MAG: preprotein translocase subunit SecY [Betaproteobacteria bacterium]|nr:preprotein translocase subunit SecY [Betaproteobacteria bacterium]
MALAEESGENLLLKRVLFTLMALLVFRLGVHIPTPGVNTKALVELASQNSGGLLKMLNMFSGGALNQFSIFALGIMPYISASIIIQLMTVVVPSLEQLQKEGGVGRQKINRITRTLAVVIAVLQGYLAATALESAPETAAGAAVLDPGFSFRILAALLLTSGTCFVMWLGEQITEKGIGNGTSLIIFAGIVAYFPSGLGAVVVALRENTMTVVTALGFLVFLVATVFGIAFIEQSYRKIAVHYAKRLVGNRVMSGQSTHLPLKVNMAGVIPAIFGSTILAVPLSFGGFFGRSESPWMAALYPNQWLHNVLFAFLVLFFCYFYTSITFKPDDIAENLKKQNAYIPGIRPGTETAEALDMVVTRLTLAGALYMNLVCLIPQVVTGGFSESLFVGGTSLLIVVGVALETVRQVSAQLATQRYDSLLFSGKDTSAEPKFGPTTERSPT